MKHSLTDVNGAGRASYPMVKKSDKFIIEIRKDTDPVKNQRISQGLKKHNTLDSIVNPLKICTISLAEVAGHATGHVISGGLLEDAGNKYAEGITSTQRS
ncbi:Similar to hypothetical protein TRIVIDRAFT_156612 [Trichoderma virens Gv29-8]; acc. no. EHK19422 [Pyronema omphalodes CBS 100304]|uniref:Uncharacterized protein n=1 Tax=Pyronema omphalodes (strain CBS 100304) TaxID=1076935 RepID=U4LP59_PYROM|nr:Similar to hypothetical protein TRIVIDRAFT_156612 [Trichoderma virens Gv29-8]; acc. no. EHK19422 [Pyronema omphalodes CBS 100304]